MKRNFQICISVPLKYKPVVLKGRLIPFCQLEMYEYLPKMYECLIYFN